jgi:hypothetical protein
MEKHDIKYGRNKIQSGPIRLHLYQQATPHARQHRRTQVIGAMEHVLPCQNDYELAMFRAASIIIVSLFLPDMTNSLL